MSWMDGKNKRIVIRSDGWTPTTYDVNRYDIVDNRLLQMELLDGSIETYVLGCKGGASKFNVSDIPNENETENTIEE